MHRRGSLSFVLLSLLSAALWASSCGRDHSLGITGSSSSGEGGGGSGSASASSGSSSGASASGTSSSAAGGTVMEPAGPTKVTVVDGINDYEAIRICFLPYPDGDAALMPWPAAAEGLAFASAAVVDPIDAAIPPGKDIRPVVFAGDLAKIAGKTCAEAQQIAAGSPGGGGAGGADSSGSSSGAGGGAGGSSSSGAGGSSSSGAGGSSSSGAGGGDAGSADGGDAGMPPPPPPLIAAQLTVLPAAVFTSPKSILLVPSGCLGGPGHDGPIGALACGFGYSPSAPAPGLVAVGMSRLIDKTHVSFQVVNASAALQPSDVHLHAGFDGGADWTLAPALAFGTIAPLPPFTMASAKGLGALDKATVTTSFPGQMFQSSSTLFTEAMAHGTLPKAAIANGTGLVLVAVGSYPGVDTGAYWHKFTFSLVKADP